MTNNCECRSIRPKQSPEEFTIYDVIIIGAGAAGLMTAIQAAQGGLRVLLLEGQKKVGAKILMSGGTRCNVTNKTVSEKDFNSHHIMNVRNILRSFTNTKTLQFFKGLGVELVLEPTGKYFPSTNSGKTVLESLLRQIKETGVDLRIEHRIEAVTAGEEGFIVKGEGFEFNSHHVVLTTGGLSYPSTGSDGVGYRLAQSFGHWMIDTTPALTPLTTQDNDFKSLSGITIDVQLMLFIDGRKQLTISDSFLFTHLGFSGPSCLDISRHWHRAKGKKQIFVNFIPPYDESSLQAHFLKAYQKFPRKTLKSLLIELMPERMAGVILKKSGIEENLAIGQLQRDARGRLIANCLHYPLDVTGVVGYSKAEVTAGGLDLAQVNPKTLESKLQPGLFLAGEILDVDGRIGGFNFQWAWASGFTVAQALIKKESSHEQKDH